MNGLLVGTWLLPQLCRAKARKSTETASLPNPATVCCSREWQKALALKLWDCGIRKQASHCTYRKTPSNSSQSFPVVVGISLSAFDGWICNSAFGGPLSDAKYFLDCALSKTDWAKDLGSVRGRVPNFCSHEWEFYVRKKAWWTKAKATAWIKTSQALQHG